MHLTIRMPDSVYEALKRHKDKEKPHNRLNAIIVEAIVGALGRKMFAGAPQEGKGSRP
jgi:hypothetical protein